MVVELVRTVGLMVIVEIVSQFVVVVVIEIVVVMRLIVTGRCVRRIHGVRGRCRVMVTVWRWIFRWLRFDKAVLLLAGICIGLVQRIVQFRNVHHIRTECRVIGVDDGRRVGILFAATALHFRAIRVTEFHARRWRHPLLVVIVAFVNVRTGRVVVRIRRIQNGTRDLIRLQLGVGEIVNHRSHVDQVRIGIHHVVLIDGRRECAIIRGTRARRSIIC